MKKVYKLTTPVDPSFEEILFSICIQEGVSCAFERISGSDLLLFHAYFSKKEDGLEKYTTILKNALEVAELEIVDIGKRVKMEEIDRDEYLLNYKNYFKDILIGDRLLIRPYSLSEKPSEKNSYSDKVIEIYIELGLAFGTGSHATTQLCLEALLNTDLNGKTVIDLGTGSGILAIASAKLGASFVYGIDIDPQAVRSAIRNVQINAVSGKVSIERGSFEYLKESESRDILVANLSAEDLEQNAPTIARAKVKKLILSGFTKEKALRLEKIFTKLGLKKVSEREKNSWSLLEFDRV